MAKDLQPDDVVFMGDLGGLDGLCRQEKKLHKEGLRFLDEKEAQNEAMRTAMEAGLDTLDNIHLTVGNHEARVDWFIGDYPYFEDALDVWGDIRAMGVNVVPFLRPLRIAGVRFQHFFPNRMGRAISSKTSTPRAVLMDLNYSESCVQGHTHKYSWHAVRTKMGGRKIGMEAGWFGEEPETYQGARPEEWWAGALLLRNVHDGDFDITEYRMDTMKREWGHASD
jgi:hypothetical protein